MPDKNLEIGRRVVAARESVGMSQRDLGRHTRLSQSTIHRIETGAREASTIELSVLADACGVLIADLLGSNRLADEVLCAGRTDEAGSKALADYMIYALGLAQRLDEVGVPEVA